jgi:hypothetical protein
LEPNQLGWAKRPTGRIVLPKQPIIWLAKETFFSVFDREKNLKGEM